jgi:hypothetical protein
MADQKKGDGEQAEKGERMGTDEQVRGRATGEDEFDDVTEEEDQDEEDIDDEEDSTF